MTETILRNINDRSLLEKGAKVLFKELGCSDAIRFLSMSRETLEDCVQRHRKWQSELDKDGFFDKVFMVEAKADGN